MQQSLTDTSRILTKLFVRSEANEDGGHTEYLATCYVLDQPVLLNIPAELSYSNVAGARRCAVLGEKATAAGGADLAAKKENSFAAGYASLRTCRIDIVYFSVTSMPSFLCPNCKRAPWAKLA